jgi:hypothetical protein
MRNVPSHNDWKTVPLVPSPLKVYESPDPSVNVSTPSILALPSGRILVAVDCFGPGVKHLPGAKGRLEHVNHWLQGKVFVSSDRGEHWTSRQTYPFRHPLLFRAGANIYLLGDHGPLAVMRSSDGGEVWGHSVNITDVANGWDRFAWPAANIAVSDGMLTAVPMLQTSLRPKGPPACTFSPAVLRARDGSDLADRRSWSITPTGAMPEFVMTADAGEGYGIPWFPLADAGRGTPVAEGRWADPPAWRCAHVFRMANQDHQWHDPKGRTLHILMTAEFHRSNLAVLLRIEEDKDGMPVLRPQTTPSGRTIRYIPVPGGHLPFSMLFDDVSGLFWLISHQVRDSLKRPDRLPPSVRGLPGMERSRLQLSVSRNLVDWWTVGLVASIEDPSACIHEPTMAIRGPDLCVAWCAGTPYGKTPHGGTRIEAGVIPAFRELVY